MIWDGAGYVVVDRFKNNTRKLPASQMWFAGAFKLKAFLCLRHNGAKQKISLTVKNLPKLAGKDVKMGKLRSVTSKWVSISNQIPSCIFLLVSN